MSALAGFLDRYQERESLLHRLDARAKLPAALGFIVAVTFTREGEWLTLALLFAPIPLLVALSRLGAALVLRRSLLALPFVATAIPLVFTRPGDPVFELPLTGWTASAEGIRAVATIMARAWIAVLTAVILVATTPAVELLRALRSLRVPALLISTISFAYRYLYVVGDEAQRMIRARDSRSATIPGARAGRSVAWRAGVAGRMVGSLFVRSLERSERVYAAMQARGYHGELRFLHNPPLPRTDLALGAALVAYGALVQAAAYLR